MYAGLLSGLAGAVLMARINTGHPAAGIGMEFDAIAGSIVGGTSFTGGTGTAWGALIGVLIIGILNNILNLMSVSSYMQSIIKGVVIVLAVIMDSKTKVKNI